MNINENIGLLIKQLREDNNISGATLADELQVAKPAISQWENGKGISIKNLVNVARFFSISVDELVKGKLDNESIEKYFDKKYDILKYNINLLLEKENEELIDDYCKKVICIKDNFFKLIIKFLNNKIEFDECAELKYLLHYFEINNNYIINRCESNNILSNLSHIIDINELDENEQKWEISKIFTFKEHILYQNYDKIKKNKTLYKMIISLSQVDKDILLNDILKEPNKLSSNELIKSLLDNGAKCFFNSNNSYFDENELKLFNNPIIKSSHTNKNSYLDISKIWAELSFKEYISLYDLRKTEKLIIKYKKHELNPKEYYKKLRDVYSNPE